MSGTRLAGAAAVALALVAAPVSGQRDDPLTTADEVRDEIGEAMEAVTAYSARERDDAVAEARAALARLDAEIARREQALRETWAEMSASARAEAAKGLEAMRASRNLPGRHVGALEAGASDAWDALSAGVSDGWRAFSEAWEAAADTPRN